MKAVPQTHGEPLRHGKLNYVLAILGAPVDPAEGTGQMAVVAPELVAVEAYHCEMGTLWAKPRCVGPGVGEKGHGRIRWKAANSVGVRMSGNSLRYTSRKTVALARDKSCSRGSRDRRVY